MSKKKIDLRNDLICIIISSIALAVVIFIVDMSILRIILGLPFVLFFPGYVLIAALFTKKDDLDGIERVALSFGLSIAVVPLLGLALNYTPFGIRLIPVFISLIIFIVIMSGIAFYRRKKLPQEECYHPFFKFDVPQWKVLSKTDKLLFVLLVMAIFFAIGSIVYVISTPKVGEKFTEFYILGTGGKAEGYPKELGANEKGFVILGIINHEQLKEEYYIETVIDGNLKKKIDPVILADGTKWERKTDFSINQPKENVKVEFLLYRKGDKKPYRTLHLWVDVSGEVNRSSGEVNKPTGGISKPTGGVSKPSGGVSKPSGGVSKPSSEVDKPPWEDNEPPGEVDEPPGEVSELQGDEPPGEVNKL